MSVEKNWECSTRIAPRGTAQSVILDAFAGVCASVLRVACRVSRVPCSSGSCIIIVTPGERRPGTAWDVYAARRQTVQRFSLTQLSPHYATRDVMAGNKFVCVFGATTATSKQVTQLELCAASGFLFIYCRSRYEIFPNLLGNSSARLESIFVMFHSYKADL